MGKGKIQDAIKTGVAPMREIFYRNTTSLKNKRRIISLCDKSENKSASTRIHRTFIYVVSREVKEVADLPAPVFFITKNFNSKTKEEKFSFRVKGIFCVAGEAGFLTVHFCHSLRIDVTPKPKSASLK